MSRSVGGDSSSVEHGVLVQQSNCIEAVASVPKALPVDGANSVADF